MSEKTQLPIPEKYSLTLASVAAFGVYFCTYAYRKPFSAASYEEYQLWGLGYKTLLVIAQVLGYTLSKFIGIRVVASASNKNRMLYLIGLLLFSELSLLLFGLVPFPYNFVFLFLNGLPLGMIWGLVFSYLEGRKTTELLAVVQSLSFVVSTAVVKAAGKFLITYFGISEFWMPFATGLLFMLPTAGFLWLLHQTPPPTAEEEKERVKRVPMTKADRQAYFRMLAPGLLLLIVATVLLTIYREIRDNYAIEILSAIGYGDKAGYLAYSEIVVAVVVFAALLFVMWIRNHQKAVVVIHGIMIGGVLLIGAATPFYSVGLLNPYLWFTLLGIGLFAAYIPFHSILFDRLIIMFGKHGNAGYLIYLVDAFGYLGSLLVLLHKSFFGQQTDWLDFFINLSYLVSILCALSLALAIVYFVYRKKNLSVLSVHSGTHFKSISVPMNILNEEQLARWERDGFLKIENFFTKNEAEAIRSSVEEVSDWQPSEDKWLHHSEATLAGVKLARTENFIPFHQKLKMLLTSGKVLSLISAAMGEEAVLYKEKINYKYPGGGGYAPHQDAPAYDEIKKHVTCLIPVDDTRIENGCLYFAPGMHRQGLLDLDEQGCIHPQTASGLEWVPVESTSRDIVLFHSFAPHKSPKNSSQHPRRALYVTYNALSEGDLREAYYRKKIENLKKFREEGAEKAKRISNIGHFQGDTIVP